MHIVVCLKPEPDVSLALEPGGAPGGLDPYSLSWRLNPAEGRALSQALRWRRSQGGRVSLLCCGRGPAVEELLRWGLLAGADRALSGGPPQQSLEESALLVEWLAGRLEAMAPDLVLCGEETSSRQRGETGPGLAQALGWPLAVGVRRIESLDPAAGRLSAWQREGGGWEQLSRLPLPAVLTFAHLPGEEEQNASLPEARDLLASLQAEPALAPEGAGSGRSVPEAPYSLALARRPRTPLPIPDPDSPPAERMAAVFQAGRSRRAGVILPPDSEQASARLVAILRERGLIREE